MKQPLRRQTCSEGLQSCLGLIEVVENTHRIDVVEGSFTLEIQEAALLLTQGAHLLRCTGTGTSLAGHRQRPFTDIHPEHIRSRIQMAEVVGADACSASGI